MPKVSPQGKRTNKVPARRRMRARVEQVVDDKSRGLIAQVEDNGATAKDIGDVLGVFTRPWEPMPKD